MRRIPLYTILLFFYLILSTFGCTQSFKAVKPSEIVPQKGSGRLITSEGYKFPYEFYPADQKAPSVIYVPGAGGKVTWKGQGGYALAKPLNKASFNFIGFNRSNIISGRSTRAHVKNAAKRSKSGSVYFPSKDGKESAAENIVKNEIQTIIEFLEKAPTYDEEKGIYLIGASMGSWLSLCTVQSFSDKIRGVVFLTPAILPEWVTTKEQAENPEINIIDYFESLKKSFGDRPALAIGSKRDIIAPYMSDGSALDGSLLLRKEIGPNVEVMEVSTSLHSNELVDGSREVRERVVKWLAAKAYSKSVISG